MIGEGESSGHHDYSSLELPHKYDPPQRSPSCRSLTSPAKTGKGDKNHVTFRINSGNRSAADSTTAERSYNNNKNNMLGSCKSWSDLPAGIMTAGALTQWTAATQQLGLPMGAAASGAA